jgi:hypothetical protein
MIPGANILSTALRVLSAQSFQYLACQPRDLNSIGVYVPSYAPPVTLTGSVQPVPRELYERYGLEFQRNYINVFVSRDVIDVARDVSGDKVTFNGDNYQCMSKTPWYAVDGWDQILCVQVQ